MLILGIDPGTATTGYGLIEVTAKGFIARDFGLIETDKENSTGRRLENIYSQMAKLLKRSKPDVVAIERIFFATNAKTAISVGQATGIMIFAASRSKIDIAEYAPGTIKKVVAGDGRADKKMIQKSLRVVFGAGVRSRAKKRTHFDNAADALAVALCHAYTIKKAKGGDKHG